MTNTLSNYTITREAGPAAFYARHAEELAAVGADAFGQPVELFAPQVAERFDKAGAAQIIRHGQQIVGFALYDVLRSGLWRPAIN